MRAADVMGRQPRANALHSALFTAQLCNCEVATNHVSLAAPMARCCCQRSFLPLAAIVVAFIVTTNSWISRNITAGHYGFSQFAQDSFVLELLGHKRGGVFVDVGASDGVWNSNSYLLEGYYGWRGVCGHFCGRASQAAGRPLRLGHAAGSSARQMI